MFIILTNRNIFYPNQEKSLFPTKPNVGYQPTTQNIYYQTFQMFLSNQANISPIVAIASQQQVESGAGYNDNIVTMMMMMMMMMMMTMVMMMTMMMIMILMLLRMMMAPVGPGIHNLTFNIECMA